MEAGADFIKTSTGKASAGATPGVCLVMLEAIRDYADRTGRIVGFKAAGGVSTSKAALHRLVLVKETLGDEWLTPDRIRIGASSVLNDLLMQYAEDRDRPLRPLGGLLQGMTSSAETRTSIVWDYSPAPESTDHVRLRDRYGLFVDGDFRDPVDGRYVPTINPATEEPLAEVAFGRPGGRARGGRERARRAQPKWAALQPLERGKYLFRIARLIQERARELAVVETMDGGKPLRESRDVDIPLAAAHFFHYAGWADKLRYGVASREVAPLGVVGQIVPWNFPLLMAAWKLAPALACGNVAILKPAETTPLTALLLAEIAQEAELPPGVVSILAGRRRDRRGARARAAHRQGRLHRLDRRRPRHPGRAGRHGHAADARARRQVGQHRVRGRRARPGRRGDRQRHLLQPGPRVLRRLAAADPGERARRGRSPSCGSGCAGCGSATRSTRTPTSARSTRPSSSSGSRRSSRPARRRARARRTIDCELPERGYWFAPTLFTDVSPAHRIAVEEIFGPVVSVLTFRTQAEAIEKANNSRYGLAAGIWTDKGAKAFEVAERAAGRRGVAEHLQPLRPDGGVRRLQGVGLRPRGRRRRAASVPAGSRDERPAGGPQDVQAVDRRRVRALGVRPLRRGRDGCQLPARLAQGRPRRGRRRAQGGRAVGGADRLQPRADPVPRGRGARVARAARSASTREEVDAAVDVLLHYAGWTDKLHAGARRRQPGRRAVPVVLAARADRRGRDRRARTRRRCSAWSPSWPRRWPAGNVVVAILSRRNPLPGLDLAEVLGRLGRARRRGQPAVGASRRAGDGARRPPRPQRDRRRRRRRRAVGRARPAGGRDDQARAPRPRRERATRPPRTMRSSGSRRSPSSKTAWHPVGA